MESEIPIVKNRRHLSAYRKEAAVLTVADKRITKVAYC
jgi:hypothetical protein